MLHILNTNNNTPYGQFDCVDGYASQFLGGEVCTMTGVAVTAPDAHAADINDGYTTTAGANSFTRPGVTLAMTGNEGSFVFLSDDGTVGYGTLFGSLLGAGAGAGRSSGVGATVFGPSTIAGSGKVTLWGAAGLYGVSMDALDTANFNQNTSSLFVGAPLSYNANGKLTPVANKVGNAKTVANFVEFSAGDSMVATPVSLTRAGFGPNRFKMAIIHYLGVGI